MRDEALGIMLSSLALDALLVGALARPPCSLLCPQGTLLLRRHEAC